MANRLTDTTIWKNQRWFKKMPPLYKLAWKYITDMCDHAGIWKIDVNELKDDLGVEEFDLKDFFDYCNCDFHKKTGHKITRQRIIEIDEEKIWLTGYVNFQYGGKTHKIKKNNKVVISAFEILMSLNLFDLGLKKRFFCLAPSSPSEPLQAPLSTLQAPPSPSKPLGGAIEKDKEKEKDKEIDTTEKVFNTGNGSVPKDQKGVSETLKKEGEEKNFKKLLLLDKLFYEKIGVGWGIDEKGFEKMINYFEIHVAARQNNHPNYQEYQVHFKNYFAKDLRYLPYVSKNKEEKDAAKRQREIEEQETRDLEK